jgi:hypothetical protein
MTSTSTRHDCDRHTAPDGPLRSRSYGRRPASGLSDLVLLGSGLARLDAADLLVPVSMREMGAMVRFVGSCRADRAVRGAGNVREARAGALWP